jgi:deoxyribodipyrimidine photo-lyase
VNIVAKHMTVNICILVPMKTAIVWFRNDLRVHDNPALHEALQTNDAVVPVFILTPEILHSKRSSTNRNRFLQQCLEDLQRALRKLGGDLLVTQGTPEKVLTTLAHEYDATAVFCATDYTPFAIKRDHAVGAALADVSVAFHQTPGRTIVSNVTELRTKTNGIYKVFTPFYKTWLRQNRRQLAPTPQHISLPPNFQASPEYAVYDSLHTDLSPQVIIGGETSARIRLESFLRTSVANYEKLHNDLAADATSRLSAYFHFGCISPLEAESMLPDNDGARSWQRQLAWRDFYMYILYHFPGTVRQSFQEPFANLMWTDNRVYLEAWKEGKTGYPLVDAAMRQLRAEGFMHNRARLLGN